MGEDFTNRTGVMLIYNIDKILLCELSFYNGSPFGEGKILRSGRANNWSYHILSGPSLSGPIRDLNLSDVNFTRGGSVEVTIYLMPESADMPEHLKKKLVEAYKKPEKQRYVVEDALVFRTEVRDVSMEEQQRRDYVALQKFAKEMRMKEIDTRTTTKRYELLPARNWWKITTLVLALALIYTNWGFFMVWLMHLIAQTGR